MEHVRRYRNRRGGGFSPLLDLAKRLQSGESLGSLDLEREARRVGLPVATLRGSLSFYSDLSRSAHSKRVCMGTSCFLAGATRPKGSTGVYCLGHCNQSPCSLDEEGHLLVSGVAQPLSVQVRASHQIITGRIDRQNGRTLQDATKAGAYGGLTKAMEMTPNAVLEEVLISGQRGRGGAAFPTGRKWQTCAQTSSEIKYVIANGDEGDPGSYIDRLLMEEDPHVLLEGMAICAYAVGAKHGIVFIRSEYPQAIQSVSRAIEEAKEAGALGDFDVWVFPALGSYVCGEETALLNTLEGLRGEVRLRPPYPAVEGLYGRPTVVNNIETLAAIPWIIQNGGQAFQTMGTRESSGTKVLCFDHAFAKPGVVEVEFGHSLAEVIQENALGGNAGKELEAVLLGGPMGSIIEIEKWDVPICYGEMRKAGIELGHGGVVGLLQGFDPSALLLHHLEFMKDESCGKCVPCKLGSARGLELAHQIPNASSIRKLRDLFDLMRRGSLCAFGQLMPGAMKFLLHRVEEDSNV